MPFQPRDCNTPYGPSGGAQQFARIRTNYAFGDGGNVAQRLDARGVDHCRHDDAQEYLEHRHHEARA
jgi:hypothetical protein